LSRPGYVYLMANHRRGRTYLGVTSNLAKRVWEHRNGVGSEYAIEHDCKILVWFEAHDDIQNARVRELQMKKWKRPWKIELIEKENPEWRDLFDTTQWN
jgi:putative endonuclease